MAGSIGSDSALDISSEARNSSEEFALLAEVNDIVLLAELAAPPDGGTHRSNEKTLP